MIEARKAVRLAELQVIEAKRNAAAAEESAAEARKANEFAVEKDGRERAERFAEQHELDKPRFTFVRDGWTHVRVTMVDGPPEVRVHIARVAIVTQNGESLEVPISLANDPNVHTFAKNAARNFAVDMRAEKVKATARLVLLSEETDGKRSWEWTEEVDYPPPPAGGSIHAALGEIPRHIQPRRSRFM